MGLTVTVTVVIGAFAINAKLGGSATGRGASLSVQVSIDLNKAVKGLGALEFRGARSPNYAASSPSYGVDCADSATRKVKQFLIHHPCKEYASVTLTGH